MATELNGNTLISIRDSNGNQANVIPCNGCYGVVAVAPGHVSTANSTITPLISEGTYTGTWEDVTNFGVIVITLKSNVASATNGLAIQFSSDGTNIDSTDTYTIPADTGKTFSCQAACKYFRVVYTNGGTGQTYFRLQTVLKPYYVKPSSHRIADSIIEDDDAELVKAVVTGENPAGNFVNFKSTTAGNFKMSLEELENGISTNSNSQLKVTTYNSNGVEGTFLKDSYGFELEFTPTNEIRSISPTRLIGSVFTGTTIDTNFWSTALTGTGGATQSGGQITLNTGATANSTAQLNSIRRARYTGGSALRYRSVIQLADGETGTANNIRRWGAFDDSNGCFFELNGTTLNVVTRKNTTDEPVASDDWNGTLFTIDLNAHTYEIYWTNSSVWFVIDGNLVHTATFPSTTWTDTATLPLRAENRNTNGLDSDILLSVRVQTIYRLGELITQSTSKYQSGTIAGLVLKYGAGNLHGGIISGVNQNSVITLYDNTAASGTVLWSSGAMAAQTQPFAIDFFDIPFSLGLTLVVAAANSNVMVAYE